MCHHEKKKIWVSPLGCLPASLFLSRKVSLYLPLCVESQLWEFALNKILPVGDDPPTSPLSSNNKPEVLWGCSSLDRFFFFVCLSMLVVYDGKRISKCSKHQALLDSYGASSLASCIYMKSTLHLHKHKILPYKHTEQVVTTMMVYSILSRFQCQLVFFCISLLVKWRSIVMCFVWWIQLPSYCGGALISTLFIDKTLSIWQRTFFGDTSLIFGWHVLSVHVA